MQVHGSVIFNPSARRYQSTPPDREPLEFHQKLPGYRPGPLISAPGIASALGLGEVWIKDESNRFGLPAFKVLGASWAAYRALADRLPYQVEPWDDLDELKRRLAPLKPLTLVAATAGNHGRALARIAALLEFQAEIFVPAVTTPSRIEAIRGEGATVTIVEGTYDDALRQATEEVGDRRIVVSDMTWAGYQAIPQWAIDGYSTVFWEADELLESQGASQPDIVVVQMGCGALAASAVRHFRRPTLTTRPVVIGVEPTSAACVFASVSVGRPVSIPGPFESMMAGLNAGTPSAVAWPLLQGGVDAIVKVEDDQAREAMRLMAGERVVSGETGAAGVAGLIELTRGPSGHEVQSRLRLGPLARVLVVSTEGATDPERYSAIVDEAAHASGA